MKELNLAFLLIVVLASCNSNQNSDSQSSDVKSVHLSHAEKFTFSEEETFTTVSVFNPWQKASNITLNYILASDTSNIPDSLSHYQFIKTPLEKVVVMSTTYTPMIEVLGELASIIGVSGGKYIYNEELFQRYEAGDVRDIGSDYQLNYEVLVDLNPDVIFMYGLQAGVIQQQKKIMDMGIPVVLCADYLETNPLGRSEWLKFFSLFYNKLDEATEICNSIASEYQEISASINEDHPKPKVMTGLPWKDSWYISGGRSYLAQLISDAGGDYVWSDFESDISEAKDLETVFLRTLDADIWINPGVARVKQDIENHDSRFTKMKSFRNDKIFSNNKRSNPGGGNDYYESGALYPNKVLKDMNIIYRGEEENYKDLYYFQKLD